jgi:hypothetical protein
MEREKCTRFSKPHIAPQHHYQVVLSNITDEMLNGVKQGSKFHRRAIPVKFSTNGVICVSNAEVKGIMLNSLFSLIKRGVESPS